MLRIKPHVPTWQLSAAETLESSLRRPLWNLAGQEFCLLRAPGGRMPLPILRLARVRLEERGSGQGHLARGDFPFLSQSQVSSSGLGELTGLLPR